MLDPSFKNCFERSNNFILDQNPLITNNYVIIRLIKSMKYFNSKKKVKIKPISLSLSLFLHFFRSWSISS